MPAIKILTTGIATINLSKRASCPFFAAGNTELNACSSIKMDNNKLNMPIIRFVSRCL